MKKVIKILTIVSGAIIVLSMLAMIACVVMQRSMASIYYSAASEMDLFVFPAARFVYVVGILLCSVLLFFSAAMEKLGIWAEIVALVFIAAVLPFAQTCISYLQTMLVGNVQGMAVLAYTSAVNNLVATATSLVPFATSVLLFVSGLSIASKVYER